MMEDLDRYKDVLEKKRQERDRLKGRQDALMEDLKNRGFDSLTEADDELTKLSSEIEIQSEKVAEMKTQFDEKFGELLK